MNRATIVTALSSALALLAGCSTPNDLPVEDADGGTLSDPDASSAPDADSPADVVTDVPEGPRPPAALRIATWNIEAFPRHESTIETVAALIEDNDLDLVGVQEITEPEHFEALAAALPDHDMYVSFDPWGYTRVGFLYRRSLIEVGDVDRVYTGEREAFPRDPLVAEIRVVGDEGETRFDFTLMVVHLKAQIDEESRQRRIAAVSLLDQWARAQMAIDPDVVILGDFNDELTDAPEWNVFRPLLDAPDVYRFLTLDAERAGQRSYIPFRAMIDHILVTTDAMGEYGDGYTEVLELDHQMSGYLDIVSDHRPVVASFMLP